MIIEMEKIDNEMEKEIEEIIEWNGDWKYIIPGESVVRGWPDSSYVLRCAYAAESNASAPKWISWTDDIINWPRGVPIPLAEIEETAWGAVSSHDSDPREAE